MLSERIEDLYRVFEKYPLRANIAGCPHCDLGAAEDALHSRALRDLSWEDIQDFSFKAMTTFGDLDDYRHFLPRILELLAVDYANEPYGVHHVFSKLDYGNWRNWPADEQRTVRLFVAAWLQTLDSNERDDALACAREYGVAPADDGPQSG